MKTTRILLVDDHEVVRLGLKRVLENVPWIKIVAEAGTAEEALGLVPTLHPDIVIMDIRLPDESGLAACRHITSQWPNIKVIILSAFGDEELIAEALRAGASGYVLKQISMRELVRAIEAVQEGLAALDPVGTARVLKRLHKMELEHQQMAFKDLTEREMQVLWLVAQGKSNSEIAEILSLSRKTVSHHVSAILTKLGLNNRIEAATYAVRYHIEDFIEGEGKNLTG